MPDDYPGTRDFAVPDPERDIVLDSRSLRGLAHPLRVRLLGLLRADGPSTASKLAERVGLSSAATSYHLRQLATYGFVREQQGRGQPRERWWEAAHRSTYLGPSSVEPEAIEDAQAYLRAVAQGYAQQIDAFLDELPALDPAWQEASDLSDFALQLTPAQAGALRDELIAVLSRYPARDAASTASGETDEVRVQLQLFRRPGQPVSQPVSQP